MHAMSVRLCQKMDEAASQVDRRTTGAASHVDRRTRQVDRRMRQGKKRKVCQPETTAACCRCNKKGSCKNCACVKGGRYCFGCLPGRLGNCRNVDLSATVDDSLLPSTVNSPILPQFPSSDPQSSLMSHVFTVPNVDSPSLSITRSCPDLPSFETVSPPQFRWGECEGHEAVDAINDCYNVVVHWVRNLFKVPFGKAGKGFVQELSRLIRSYSDNSALESVAIKASLIFPPLMLQKSSKRSKTKEHIALLERRLVLWKEGRFKDLLKEGNTLQKCLRRGGARRDNKNRLSKSFAHLMFEGRTREAFRLLDENSSSGRLLSLDSPILLPDGSSCSTREVLLMKHPLPGPISPEKVLLGSTPDIDHDPHSVLFDQLDSALIRRVALRVQGAAGPSGADSQFWRRVCSSFSRFSDDLCGSLAVLARKLATTYVDPDVISPFVACRLIALDKNPGVRPIGIGEVSRRIVSKALLIILKSDILESVGSRQLCAGHEGGCEAAVHAVQHLYKADSVEGLLFVDASNAFNALNRGVALRNVLHLCPSFGRVLVNVYRNPVSLFIDGDVLYSQEGTTQGDPLAMSMFAIATIPLIDSLKGEDLTQVWYADDATAGGPLTNVREWWNHLIAHGPGFGYYPNPSKTVLLTKESCLSKAHEIFDGTGITITVEGKEVLGVPVGTNSFVSSFITSKVTKWVDVINRLSTIAEIHPHAAFSAFGHGIASRWTYFFRVVPLQEHDLQLLEDAIQRHFIPSIIGSDPPSPLDRDWISLPIRFGGLGLFDPRKIAPLQYESSVRLCSPLVECLLQQSDTFSYDDQLQQYEMKKCNIKEREKFWECHTARVTEVLPPDRRRLMELAREKGASAWLSVLPLADHGFALNKSTFRDAVFFRFGWTLPLLPSTCVCGHSFSVEHALNCPMGGLQTQRHNEIRDLTADMLKDVCHNVVIEPTLQPVHGVHFDSQSTCTDDGARLDIAADGFWEAGRRSFFDVRIFNPIASSYQRQSLSSCYTRVEREKMRKFEERIREVEFGSFSPLVFSTTGGYSAISQCVYKKLATLMATKYQKSYSNVINYIRCRTSFSLLRSTILCVRGTRSKPPSSRWDHLVASSDCVTLSLM